METAKKLVLPVAAVVVIYALTTGDTINEDAQYNWGPPPPHDDNLHVYADSPHGDHTRVLPIRFEGGEKDYSEKFIPGEIVTFMQDSANFQTSKEMNALIQEERREWRNDSKYSPSIAHYSREVIQFLRHNLQVLEDARGNATTSAGVPNHDNLKSLYHKQQKIFFLFGRPNEVGGGIGTLKAELSFHWNRAKHIIDSSDSRESVLLGQDKFRTPFETIEHLEMELREIYVEFNRLGDQYSKINGDIQAVLDEHNFQPQKSNFITRLFQTVPVNDSSLTPEKRVGCMSKVVSNLARCLPKEPVPGEMGTGEVTVTDRVYPENDFAQRKAPQLRSKLRSPNRRGYQKVNTGKVRSAPITKKRTFDVSVAKHIPAMPQKVGPFNQGAQPTQLERLGPPIALDLSSPKKTQSTESVTVSEIEYNLKKASASTPLNISTPMYSPISVKVVDVGKFNNRTNAIALKSRSVADEKKEGYRSVLIQLQIELDNLVPTGYARHTMADAVDTKSDIFTLKGEKITYNEALGDPIFMNYQAKLLEVRRLSK